MFEAVEGLVAEGRELEERLADPATHADQGLAKRLNQRYAEVSAIVRTWEEWRRLGDDVEAARELAATTPTSRRRPTRSAYAAKRPRNGCATCWCPARPPTPRT
jgi:protein subunit release factor A